MQRKISALRPNTHVAFPPDRFSSRDFRVVTTFRKFGGWKRKMNLSSRLHHPTTHNGTEFLSFSIFALRKVIQPIAAFHTKSPQVPYMSGLS